MLWPLWMAGRWVKLPWQGKQGCQVTLAIALGTSGQRRNPSPTAPEVQKQHNAILPQGELLQDVALECFPKKAAEQTLVLSLPSPAHPGLLPQNRAGQGFEARARARRGRKRRRDILLRQRKTFSAFPRWCSGEGLQIWLWLATWREFSSIGVGGVKTKRGDLKQFGEVSPEIIIGIIFASTGS